MAAVTRVNAGGDMVMVACAFACAGRGDAPSRTWAVMAHVGRDLPEPWVAWVAKEIRG
jgi:hypothetical protein